MLDFGKCHAYEAAIVVDVVIDARFVSGRSVRGTDRVV